MSQGRRIPTRTCVVCREKRPKNDLLRIVRSPSGEVRFDESGRLDGRGAYVCNDANHWGEGLNTGKLGHALKIDIDESVTRSINEAVISHLSE